MRSRWPMIGYLLALILLIHGWIRLTPSGAAGLLLFVESENPPSSLVELDLRLVGQFGGRVRTVIVQGNRGYAGIGSRLVIFDLTDPTTPQVIGQSPALPDMIRSLYLAPPYVYAAVGEAGLWLIDIADEQAPILAADYDTPGIASDVSVAGSFAYIADGFQGGLVILDVTAPTTPTLVRQIDLPGDTARVAVERHYAYVATSSFSDAALRVLDVSDPYESVRTAMVYNIPGIKDIAIAGDRVYLARGLNGLQILGFYQSPTPITGGIYDTPGRAEGVHVVGDLAFVADRNGGLRIVDVHDASAPTEIGAYDALSRAQDVFATSEHAFVVDAEEGLRVIDVSQPVLPTEIGSYEPLQSANSISMAGHYALLASKRLWVMDISDPATPKEINHFNSPGIVQDAFALGTYAYVVDGGAENSGLQILDISDPGALTQVGALALPDWGLDVFVTEVPPPSVAGSSPTPDARYAYVATGETGLHIVDLQNQAMPVETGAYNTPGSAQAVFVQNHRAYVADERAGLRIIDVSDPYHPVEIGAYDTLGTAWDVAAAGLYAYVADGSAGLRIIDTTDPAHLREIAALETPGIAWGVHLVRDWALVADGKAGLQVIDISEPVSPHLLGTYDTAGDARDVTADERYFYVADADGGLVILAFDLEIAPVYLPAVLRNYGKDFP